MHQYSSCLPFCSELMIASLGLILITVITILACLDPNDNDLEMTDFLPEEKMNFKTTFLLIPAIILFILSPADQQSDAAKNKLTSEQSNALQSSENDHLETPAKTYSEANILFRTGKTESRLGNIEAAREAYNKAGMLYRLIHDMIGEANVFFSIGELEQSIGNIASARKAYNQAGVLYSQLHNNSKAAHVLFVLGEMEKSIGNVEIAQKAYGEARILYKQIGDHHGPETIDKIIKSLE
ncbi:MAG: hypothetical protein D3923_16020 [Candidatus Electrothrix sp. AR3]|nr:hypothetical protein [Candidatus Electrothrix sp. AR3]